MFIHSLEKNVDLRLLEPHHANELFCCIDTNRAYLRPWLVWVDRTHTVADVEAFIQTASAQYARNAGFHAGIFVDGHPIGAVGCHEIDWVHRNTSVGYWVAEQHQRHGYSTRAVQALLDYAFSIWKLNRVEIRCATDNIRSRLLAERLGFTAEGIKRQAERIGSSFRDLIVYSILAQESLSPSADPTVGPSQPPKVHV